MRRRSIGLAAAAGLVLAGTAQAAPNPWEAKGRELLARTIALPTVQGRGQVPAMAEYLAGEFRKAGFAAEDVTIVPHGETASLVVRYRGDGSAKKKPVLAIAHMDVVDALPSDWSKDPFELTEEGGYLYGRGTSDMKGGLVALTTAFLRMKAEGYRPKRDLILAFSGDEETDGATIEDLVKNHRQLIDAEYALNADAGGGAFDRTGKSLGFSFQTSEKLYASWEITAKNRGGHSSLPRPDNAIYELAHALTKLEAHRFKPMLNDTTRAYYEVVSKIYGGELGEAMRRFAANPDDVAAADRIEQDEGEVGGTRTTCVATLLKGGHAENALPQTASATVNCRIFPGVTPEAVEAELKAAVADPQLTVTPTGQPHASPASPVRADVMGAYAAQVRRQFPGVPVYPSMSAGATDGAYLRTEGIPTFGTDGLWGVIPDDMRAHGREERIPVKAFSGDLEHWYGLLKALSAH